MLTRKITRAFTGLRWTRVERALAPALHVLLVYSYYLAGALFLLGRDDRARVIDEGVVQGQIPVFAAIVGGAILLILTGLWMRRRASDSLLFQHVCAQYYGLTLVWAGFLTGPLGYAAGVVLMGSALAGYIALERRVILTAFGTAFFAILGLNLATAFDLLPYAPALRAPTDSASALLWTHVTFFLAAPHILFVVGAMALMLGFWQKRENYVLRLGLTDVLTGVHNRRSILDLLAAETARAQCAGTPLAVALLDLDHFKRINDTWGHPAGDRVLQEAARALRACLREGDAIGRFGGEEFLLVLPGLAGDAAVRLAERCRGALAALELHAGSGERMPVSGSFGVAWYVAGGPAEALVHAADALLYEAKQAGRNRVVARELAATTAASPAPAEVTPPRVLRSATALPAARARALRLLQEFLAGWPAWNQADKQIFFLGVSALMTLNFAAWGVVMLMREDRGQFVDMALALPLLFYLGAVVLGFLGLIGVGVLIRRRWPNSWLYQFVCQQYFALTLVFSGYVTGILSFPVGVMLVGLPLVGFIYFSRPLVLLSFATSFVVTVVLAYASALGVLPYAPMLAGHIERYQPHSFFWVFTFYQFTVPAMAVILVLADQTLGRWRQRGQQVVAISRTDALTQVHNRRNILGLVEREVARTQRRGPGPVVVLLDLDHFKRINDTWGHPTGDRVLQEAARVLAATLREGDAVGRYGGEEFLILLPETPLAGAAALVERCREQLAAITITADNGDRFAISASFGVAGALQPSGRGAEALIKAADEALYRAKELGRNRVETVALTA
ncbi:MAG: hypothetical protein K0S46_1266 [Moraxellaceae bacterium]|jgi:diguanylate cyclase (GGDEF)-like protein|nr:hypothetical protein [Moraxellaceae bacterium]